MLEDMRHPTKEEKKFIPAADDRLPSNRPSPVKNHPASLPVRRWRPHPITQWTSLWHGEFVELREGHKVTATGRVDEVTDDGATIWIYLSSGMGRKMLHSDDGIDIWRVEARICQDRPQTTQ
jgi:hypothetical protein